MIEIKTKVYNFSELGQEAKERAMEKHYNDEKYLFLEEDLNEYLLQILKEKKIIAIGDTKLLYSLSYSQGDGACFTGRFEWRGIQIKIAHNFRYYHKRSTNIDLYHEDDEGNIEDVSKELQDEFLEIYYAICERVEKAGYAEIEYRMPEDEFSEYSDSNDLLYYASGERYQER